MLSPSTLRAPKELQECARRLQPSGDVLVPETAVSAEHRCSLWTVLGS